MASILKFHDYLSYEYPGINKTISQYPLLGSPIPILAIVFSYVYFCKQLGPKLMKNRKPFSLHWSMVFYNIFQVAANLYLFILAVKEIKDGWTDGFNVLCFFRNKYVNANVDEGLYLLRTDKLSYLGYFYYLLKISDFMDTIFMVLKKNFHQVSILHVYHHASMPIMVAICIKYLPQTQNIHAAIPNMFVHIFVYGYYLASTFSPEIKKSIRIKKCVTIIQLTQFIYVLTIIAVISLQKRCPISMTMSWIISSQTTLMIFLFSNFYYQAYIVRGKNRKLE